MANGRTVRSLVLKASVSAAVAVYVMHVVAWDIFWKQMTTASPLWLAAAFGLLGIGALQNAARWRYLLRVQKVVISAGTAVRLTFIGMFFNAFLIGSVGGDLAKVGYVARVVRERRAGVLASVVSDRIIGLLALLAFGLAALPWEIERVDGSDATRRLVVILTGAVLCLTGGIAVLLFMPFHRFPPAFARVWQRIPLRGFAEAIVATARLHLTNRSWALRALAVAATVPATFWLVGSCLAHGLGFEAPIAVLMVVLPLAFLIAALPISISGLGVREGAYVVLFRLLHIGDPESAVAFSLLSYFLGLVWSGIGGIVFLTTRLEAVPPEGADQTSAAVPPDPVPVGLGDRSAVSGEPRAGTEAAAGRPKQYTEPGH